MYKSLKRILENTSTRSLYLVNVNSRLFSLVTWKDQVITFLGESQAWQLNLQRLPTYLEVKLLGQQVYFKWTQQYSTRSPIFDYTKKKLWRVHYLLMQMEVSLVPFFKNNRLMSRKKSNYLVHYYIGIYPKHVLSVSSLSCHIWDRHKPLKNSYNCRL